MGYVGDKTIVVDFDGTICGFDYPKCGSPEPGVREALQELRDMGYKIVVHSLRTSSIGLDGKKDLLNRTRHIRILLAYLNEHDIPHDEVLLDCDNDKPAARFYIDDCGVTYKGSWENVVKEIKQRER